VRDNLLYKAVNRLNRNFDLIFRFDADFQIESDPGNYRRIWRTPVTTAPGNMSMTTRRASELDSARTVMSRPLPRTE
jgi:hypothetical protein